MPLYEELRSILQNVKLSVSRVGRVPILLILLWVWAVNWGEGTTFAGHVRDCTWNTWENWKGASNPHHVLLIADPQLVDPHTYPDRPWPLSSLTILYTDLYLKRAYRKLLDELQPDSVLFLGDLFDGGREWGIRDYSSPEKQYQQYGQNFWLGEYQRFQNMFVKPWSNHGMPYLPSDGGRRLITSLPGNHDLGFAGGINPQVRSRFEAHFGPTNRIDMIGNHTFVHLDTVSLSAMDQVDIETGASGTGDKSAKSSSSKIWQPVQSFLDDAPSLRERRIKREVRNLGSRSLIPELRKQTSQYPPKFPSTIETVVNSDPTTHPPKHHDLLRVSTSQFPTIILSHVPLYRPPDHFCGSFREHGISIPIHAGYQYQNVLTPLISKDIVGKLDASQIAMIYSGDDHDYCEIEHDEFTGRIREITVKSMSWAMGVRRPGVQLVSLWNPVDLAETVRGKEDDTSEDRIVNMPKGTVQNKLCLLPDQLAIFVTYAKLLGLTLVALLARALCWKPANPKDRGDLENEGPLLPTYTNGSAKRAVSPHAYPFQQQDSESMSSTLPMASITSRKGGGAQSQVGGYGNVPAQSQSRSYSPSKARFTADSDDWGMPTTRTDRVAYARQYGVREGGSVFSRLWIFRQSRTKLEVFAKSLVFVGVPVFGYYFWLLVVDL